MIDVYIIPTNRVNPIRNSTQNRAIPVEDADLNLILSEETYNRFHSIQGILNGVSKGPHKPKPDNNPHL